MITEPNLSLTEAEQKKELTAFKIEASSIKIEMSLDFLLESKLIDLPADVVKQLVRCYCKLHDVILELPSQKYETEELALHRNDGTIIKNQKIKISNKVL